MPRSKIKDKLVARTLVKNDLNFTKTARELGYTESTGNQGSRALLNENTLNELSKLIDADISNEDINAVIKQLGVDQNKDFNTKWRVIQALAKRRGVNLADTENYRESNKTLIINYNDPRAIETAVTARLERIEEYRKQLENPSQRENNQ